MMRYEIMIHRQNHNINIKPLFWKNKSFPLKFLQQKTLMNTCWRMFHDFLKFTNSICLYSPPKGTSLLFHTFKVWQQCKQHIGLDLLQVIRMRDEYVLSSCSTITSLQHEYRQHWLIFSSPILYILLASCYIRSLPISLGLFLPSEAEEEECKSSLMLFVSLPPLVQPF